MKTMVELSHDFLRPAIHKNAVMIDLTLGHGYDSLYFLKKGARKVIAFEIQKDILERTVSKLDDIRLEAYCLSHDKAGKILSEEYFERIDGIIANFGYCPNSDSKIETQPESSLEAVRQTLVLLRAKGRMSLVFYRHKDSDKEAGLIEEYLQSLDKHVYAIQKIVQFNAPDAPFAILIEKKKSGII